MTSPSKSAGSSVPSLTADERDALHRDLISLTPHQRDVVLLLGEGLRPAEIARALGVSKNTVGFHLRRVMKKLRLEDRHELLVRAVMLRASANQPGSRSPDC